MNTDLDFAKFLEEYTTVIKEDKITLYRYCDSGGMSVKTAKWYLKKTTPIPQ